MDRMTEALRDPLRGFLPLIIDNAVKARIQEIRALAEERPIPLEVNTLLEAGKPIPKGSYDDFKVRIPMGFSVIFTHETQPKGLLKHLSMSVDLAGRVPRPLAVQMLMDEFGFAMPLEKCIFWEEGCGGGQVAINVLEPVDGDWEPFRKTPENA